MEIDTINTLVAKSFAIGNYSKRDGTASFFVYALGEDGNIYRLDDRAGGWYSVPMSIVKPLIDAQQQSDE